MREKFEWLVQRIKKISFKESEMQSGKKIPMEIENKEEKQNKLILAF